MVFWRGAIVAVVFALAPLPVSANHVVLPKGTIKDLKAGVQIEAARRNWRIGPEKVDPSTIRQLPHDGTHWFERGLDAYKAHNYAAAAQIFIPLAEQGHAEAQRLLGVMYMHGDGVEQDAAMASYWVGMAEAQKRRKISQ